MCIYHFGLWCVCFACISIDYWICYLDAEYIGTTIICFYSTPSKYTLYNESIWNARKLLSTIVSDTTVFPLYFTRFLFHNIILQKKEKKTNNFHIYVCRYCLYMFILCTVNMGMEANEWKHLCERVRNIKIIYYC